MQNDYTCGLNIILLVYYNLGLEYKANGKKHGGLHAPLPVEVSRKQKEIERPCSTSSRTSVHEKDGIRNCITLIKLSKL